MRIFAALAASTHICLAACQTSPEALLPPPGGTSPLAVPAATPLTVPVATPSPALKPTPYMRCVNDFWGNCTGVASNRHDYRWRYVKPGARPRDLRESPTARENIATSRATPAVREPAPPRDKAASPKEKAASPKDKAVPPREKAAAAKDATVGNQNIPMREKVALRDKPGREAAVMIRDTTAVCHARRRVVGDERPSQDDARRAAENGWMGAVRYDFGERYQDINRAKDVRLNCGPSSISAVLKTPHFRCSVEATPCRETQGTPMEPDERRYDPPVREDQISRK